MHGHVDGFRSTTGKNQLRRISLQYVGNALTTVFQDLPCRAAERMSTPGIRKSCQEALVHPLKHSRIKRSGRIVVQVNWSGRQC